MKILDEQQKKFEETYKESSLFNSWDGCEKDLKRFLLSSNKAVAKAVVEEMRGKIEGLEFNVRDFRKSFPDIMAGKKTEREELWESIFEIITPEVKRALLASLPNYDE